MPIPAILGIIGAIASGVGGIAYGAGGVKSAVDQLSAGRNYNRYYPKSHNMTILRRYRSGYRVRDNRTGEILFVRR